MMGNGLFVPMYVAIDLVKSIIVDESLNKIFAFSPNSLMAQKTVLLGFDNDVQYVFVVKNYLQRQSHVFRARGKTMSPFSLARFINSTPVSLIFT